MRFRPLRSGVKSNFLVAARRFHSGAEAFAAFEAHDALKHAESENAVAQRNGAMERQAGVFHAAPLVSILAAEHLARTVEDGQEVVTMCVIVQ